jgi:hypothetical protein
MTKNKNKTKSSTEPEHFIDFDAELSRLEDTVDSMMERILNYSGRTRLPVLMRKWEEIHSTVASKIMCKNVQKRYHDNIWKWKKNLSKKQLKRPENQKILFLYQNAKCVHMESNCFDDDHVKTRSIFDIQLPPGSKHVTKFVETKKVEEIELNDEKEEDLLGINENLIENSDQDTRRKSIREFEHEEEGQIDEAEDQQQDHTVEEEEGPPRKKIRYTDTEIPRSDVKNIEENDEESSDWDDEDDEEQLITRKVKNDFVLTEEELKVEELWYDSDPLNLKFHCSFHGDNESHGVHRWQCLSSRGELPSWRSKVVLNETNEKDKHLLEILGIPKKSAEEFLTVIFNCTSCY